MFGSKSKIEKELAAEQKEQKENQLKWHHYLIAILFVLVGAVLIAYKEIDIPFICGFFACVFAIAGIVCVLSYCIRDVSTGYFRLDLVYGVMLLFMSLLFFTKQEAVGAYFPIIAGIILFANGVVKLQHSIDMKRIDRKMKKVTEMWLVVMIFALMCIAAGTVSVYLTPQSQRTLFVFIGISLIAAGVTDVFTHIVFNRKVKLFKSGRFEAESEKSQDGIGTENIPSFADTANTIETVDAEIVTEPASEDISDMESEGTNDTQSEGMNGTEIEGLSDTDSEATDETASETADESD